VANPKTEAGCGLNILFSTLQQIFSLQLSPIESRVRVGGLFLFSRSRLNPEKARGIWVGPVVGKLDLQANMAAKREPSKKVVDKHAKFLAAWEAAGFPDKFEFQGTTLNNVRSTADWYREQKLTRD
jgi:hypothetical protein